MSSWYVYVMRPAACSALSAVSMTPSHGSAILDEYAATTVNGAADGSWATATGPVATAQRPMTASVVDRARRRRVITAPLSLWSGARFHPVASTPIWASSSAPAVESSRGDDLEAAASRGHDGSDDRSLGDRRRAGFGDCPNTGRRGDR